MRRWCATVVAAAILSAIPLFAGGQAGAGQCTAAAESPASGGPPEEQVDVADKAQAQAPCEDAAPLTPEPSRSVEPVSESVPRDEAPPGVVVPEPSPEPPAELATPTPRFTPTPAPTGRPTLPAAAQTSAPTATPSPAPLRGAEFSLTPTINYVSRVYRWSIRYPAGWRVSDSDPSNVTWEVPDVALVGVRSVTDIRMSVDQFADLFNATFEDTLRKMGKTVSTVSRSRVTLSGNRTAVRVEHLLGPGGRSIQQVVIVDGRGFVVDAETTEELWPLLVPTFTAMLDSFTVQ